MISPPECAPPDPHPRDPQNAIPAGACDCHFHIFDGPSPQVAERSYSATPAPLTAYKRVQSALKLDRGVVIQPSIYGTDNRTTLASLPSDGTMKAVVVVNDDVPINELAEHARRGAVGARVNLLFSSNARTDDLISFAAKLADVNWHLQVLTDVSQSNELVPVLANLPVPVVIDHMGHVPISAGVNDPGFQSLLAQLADGQLWVKLSGAYRITASEQSDYSDVAPMAQALIAANPDQLVWGSDWPHPAFGGPMPNDGDLLDLLFTWCNSELAHRILVENPQILYGFPPWEVSDGQ